MIVFTVSADSSLSETPLTPYRELSGCKTSFPRLLTLTAETRVVSSHFCEEEKNMENTFMNACRKNSHSLVRELLSDCGTMKD